MSAERMVIAACVGLVNGSLVWAVSAALGAHHRWPGAIMAFALTTLSTLSLLRAISRGGR